MSTSSSKKVIYAALVGNSLIAVTKFIAASMTGSSAMLSEGIHSLVDTGNQMLLLHGIKQSQKPADEDFPYGHGKEIYFWSFIVAIMVFALGAGISLYEGIHHIFHPNAISNPMINYIVLGLAMLFEGAALFYAVREFKAAKGPLGYIEAVQKGKDPSLFVVVFEDSAAMLGLIVAFLGVVLAQVTGNFIFDGIASVIIAFILAGTALWMAIETKSLLIGESANQPIREGINNLINDMDEIEHLNEALTMHMGPEFILVNISADFASGISFEQVEKTIATLELNIKKKFPMVKKIFIEAESIAHYRKTLEADNSNEPKST
ncbi:MAG: cation transporter [Thiotrichaceae bacterium]|nr:cation transporter [Thiotrichaceae bacterium]